MAPTHPLSDHDPEPPNLHHCWAGFHDGRILALYMGWHKIDQHADWGTPRVIHGVKVKEDGGDRVGTRR